MLECSKARMPECPNARMLECSNARMPECSDASRSSSPNWTRSSSSPKCKATQSTRTSSRRRSSVLWQGSARSRQRSQRPDKSRRGGGPVEGRGIGQKPQPLLKRNHQQCQATAAFGTSTRERPGCSIAQMPKCCSRALNAAKRC